MSELSEVHFLHAKMLPRREKIWDHCAGFVIVEEAGGKVTDASGTRLDFSKGRFLLDRCAGFAVVEARSLIN